MFVLLYVPAVGMKGDNCTAFVSRFANCTFRHVPLEYMLGLCLHVFMCGFILLSVRSKLLVVL